MRSYLLFFAVVVAVLAVTHASVEQVEAEESGLHAAGPALHEQEQVLHRQRRESCNSFEEYRECDRFCRRLGLSGGACVRNKCDCDRW